MTPTAPSPFAVRGIVEGFYGNPWTHEQRLELLGFMASRGMNTFVYTPKDDPLVRRAWRAPYEGRELRRLNELVNRALATGVDFVFCVSPGLSMRYSDESDLDALASKFASVEALGVQAFGLLFDDIPRELQHVEDRAAFDTLADAHVSVANHVADRLGQRTRLIVCPTVYWGYGHRGVPRHRSAPASSPASTCSGPGAPLLPDARRRGRGGVRADGPPARDVLGQLPGQRRGDGLRAPHRPLSRPRPAPVPARVRRRRQRHGAVRGVEDPVRDDRRLPRRARDLRPREELAPGDPRRRG